MEIVEVVSGAAAAPTDLYVPAMIGVIDPRHASHVIQILSEKLPLELYGVSSISKPPPPLSHSLDS